MKWPFTRKSTEPPPPSLSAPFLWPVAPHSSAKDPLFTKLWLPRELAGYQAPLLTDRARYSVARWWRAAQYLATSGLLVQIAFSSAYLSLTHLLGKSCLETVIRSSVPPLPWNPGSAPVVSPCESRWLQQSEKCLEFANQGLWASSCLAFFPWPGIYSSLVCSLGSGV